MDADKEQRYIKKLEIKQGYDTFLNNPAGHDFQSWLNMRWTHVNSEIIKEKEQRVGKIDTDTLRGELRFIRDLYDKLNAVYSEASSAQAELDKMTHKQ